MNNSTYIRITGGTNNPIIYNDDYDFKIGKSIILKEGNDVTIFLLELWSNIALIASEKLKEKNLSVYKYVIQSNQ